MVARATGLALVCAVAVVTAGVVDATAPSYGGTGAPTCQGRIVTITGTSRPDYLGTDPGSDVIAGDDGDDIVMGDDPNERGSADVLCGGRGDDELFGNDGADTVSGDAGDDEIHGGRGPDVLEGGPGDDFLESGQYTGGDGVVDHVDGGAGRDSCRVEVMDTFEGCEDVSIIARTASARR